MINLSLDELRLIAQVRNISDYENKSREDLIKALSEPKPETKSKLIPKLKSEKKPKPKPKPETKTKPQPETKLKQTPKLEPEPKPKPESKPEPKLEIRVNKQKLKKFRKDFDELRHKFSEEEINEYREAFYIC